MNGWKKKLEDSGLVCKFLRFHRGHGSACPGCAGSQGAYEKCRHNNGKTTQRDESNCEIIMVYTPLCGECPYFVAAD